MPYITKSQLQSILSDLPDHSSPGRTGHRAVFPTAARVARVTVNLDHLVDILPKKDIQRIYYKYEGLPDLYYREDEDDFITPTTFEKLDNNIVQQPSGNELPRVWEICSGSSALSDMARRNRIPHLPPIDLRYGWYTQRPKDQLLILHGLLTTGVTCVFAAPNCALWGRKAAWADQL